MGTQESHALVVVDMQRKFLARAKRKRHTYYYPDAITTAGWNALVERIIRAIEICKTKQQPIVILEFDDFGPTDNKIKKAIGEYQKVFWCVKYCDDGSEEVFDVLPSINIFSVVGVNKKFCISATAKGLAEKAKVNLLEDAIGDEHGDMGWGWYSQPANTEIVNVDAIA